MPVLTFVLDAVANSGLAHAARLAAASVGFAACFELNGVAARADIGIANAGDNCTPFNSFAVGFPMPGVGPRTQRIVRQTAILGDGWKLMGWILTLRDGSLWLLPFPPGGERIAMTGVPIVLSLRSREPGDLKQALDAYNHSELPGPPGSARIDIPKHVLLSECFFGPLPRDDAG